MSQHAASFDATQPGRAASHSRSQASRGGSGFRGVASLAAIAATGLALAGCATPASEPAAAPATVTQTVAASPSAGGGSSAPVSAPSTASASAPATPAASATSSAAADPSSSPSPSVPAVKAKNERGNLVKQIGEHAGVGTPEEGLDVDFVVTKVNARAKCTQPYSEKPLNGRFVSLALEVKTQPGILDGVGWDNIEFASSGDWSFVNAKGVVSNGSPLSAATYGCLADSATLPAIGAAQKAAGLIMFDVPKEEGSLIYRPYWYSDATVGWEWKIPAA